LARLEEHRCRNAEYDVNQPAQMTIRRQRFRRRVRETAENSMFDFDHEALVLGCRPAG
jgi:hypothetical protein